MLFSDQWAGLAQMNRAWPKFTKLTCEQGLPTSKEVNEKPNPFLGDFKCLITLLSR